MKSQRNDRQCEYDRETAPQNAPVDMIWDMNAEEFLNICNKRLCNKASEKTRMVVELMRDLVAESNPEFIPFMVPNCQWLKGCPEFEPCGRFDIRK